MKVNDWLQANTKKLNTVGIQTARLDCLVLLEDILNTNRTQLLADPEHPLTVEQETRLAALITKRVAHTPLAYLRSKVEFYGREFFVNEHVLVPRPESEAMIDLLLQLRLKQHVKLADIGTGSGVLGITASLELGLNEVYLHDIDPKTLEVAQINGARYNVAANYVQKNLVNNYNVNYDVLLCNLPYVPNTYPINTAATHEPSLALFGGPDGLDLYRELFEQLTTEAPQLPIYVLTESLPEQHVKLAQLARSAGYKPAQSQNFIQLFERFET